ncbi:hypothetical protein FWD07_00905 [Candidatus Saccharibacteria bacterium]|nr:hypothetical protein [Candidatus Saccharibacteria bacterium]
MSEQVKVSIHYYRITAKGGDNGLFLQKLDDIVKNVKEIDREIECRTVSVNFNVSIQGDIANGCIRYLRPIAPSIGKQGDTTSKPILLEAEEGISEKTYFAYDSPSATLVIQYNHYGPRVRTLVSSVNETHKAKVNDEFSSIRSSHTPIIIGDHLELALNSNDIRGVEAKLKHPSELGRDMELPAVLRAFETPVGISQEIILRDKKAGMLARLFRDKIIRKESDVDYYDKLKVSMFSPETGTVEAYDLIKNKAKDEIEIGVGENSKELNETEIITELQRKLREFIEKHNVADN